MMFVLVVTSCLANGSDCYPAPAYQDLPQFTCWMNAPQLLPQWQKMHPKRVITKFSCVAEDRLALFLTGGEA